MTNQSWMRPMVRGFVWKMRLINGAIFEWWTPSSDTKRKDAVKNLMADANAWDIDEGSHSYYPEDVEAVWRTKGVRSND